MRGKIAIAGCVLMVCALSVSLAVPLQQQPKKPKREVFSALAFLRSGAGPPMVGAGTRVNVDLRINSYTTDEEAQALARILTEGGPNALLKALEKADSKGKITFTGRLGFYDFKLIRSHQTETGRRIYAVGDKARRLS